MKDEKTKKLIGKLTGAVVFLSLISIGLVITILVLFAFQTPEITIVDDKGSNQNKIEPNYPTHQKGEIVFNKHCASCHFPNKDMTGPALHGAENRGEENSYKGWIYDFIRDEDSLVKINDAYTLFLRAYWDNTDGVWTHDFNSLSDDNIRSLLLYVN